ncbi:helix-turn-helix domain-containing protein [Eubacterium ventriosum]|uniref:helix-turn-helix domain-containing protein n=1 Tax=Eubacterium ventriosum TaxID=39496 RepID=UPI00206E4954|nr:helix-turn-helix transcriptional regulator [Eubacterium ventriosum]DAT62205.1 MAG TPA: helix-turn-helix domain protein [Caudoviricetes sp.]
MSVGKRIYHLRVDLLNMSMETFGAKIGVTKSAISNIERGLRNVSKQMAKGICAAYNVNYFWLMNGEGEPFVAFPEAALEDLCLQYELDAFEKSIIEEFVKLSKEKRAVIVEYIKSIKKEL